jgi:hypothetical protein
MQPDALLSDNDVAEAISAAYAHAIAAASGYVVALRHFDRDGIDITFEAGDAMRPKIDAQLKATINLGAPVNGAFRYPCPKRNYDLLRVATQTPRILIVLDLPPDRHDWLATSEDQLVLRRVAYWTSLRDAAESDNSTSVTIDIPVENRFDVTELGRLMTMSRTGRIG